MRFRRDALFQRFARQEHFRLGFHQFLLDQLISSTRHRYRFEVLAQARCLGILLIKSVQIEVYTLELPRKEERGFRSLEFRYFEKVTPAHHH